MYDPPGRPSLAVFDNLFPSRMSGFRLAEYTYLLRCLPSAEAWCGGELIGFAGTAGSNEEELAAFRASHPSLADRVIRFQDAVASGRRPGLVYTIFLSQIHRHLPLLEAERLPFAFTLYPGGGLQLGVDLSDFRLREVCASPWFRRMIVTQRITREYVVSRGLCPPEKIVLLPGCVAVDREGLALPERPVFGHDKDALDLCFAAHRYEASGRNKGYGLFLDIARVLAGRFPHVRFHVVGGFTPEDLPVEGLSGRIVFHGAMPVHDLARFFTRMDGIVSPNAAFETQAGAFDGFPTGTCSEAALSGCAVFACDPLNSNESFLHGRDLVIIPHHAPSAAYIIGEWLRQPERLADLGRQGQAAFRTFYAPESQLAPRLRVLEECLAEPPAGLRRGLQPAGGGGPAGKGSRPKLSVLVISCNQQSTIRQAVESALAQVTPFDVEILCADDASTDPTAEVLGKIAAAAGERLTLIRRSRRLGAVGNFLETYRRCRGDYVAILEGDDYWIDLHKLAKQVEWLDAHPECSLCFHPVRFLRADGTYAPEAPRFRDDTRFSTGDLLDLHLISTCSVVCRNHRFDDLEAWAEGLPGIDWVFAVRHSLEGSVALLNEPMAVYRCEGGISSSLDPEGSLRSAIAILERLRSRLDAIHHPAIDAAVARRARAIEEMPSRAGRPDSPSAALPDTPPHPPPGQRRSRWVSALCRGIGRLARRRS
jgi:glycosyltransferase involved in cell wall biosynthesis